MSVINKVKIDNTEYDIGADYSNIDNTPNLSNFITKDVNDLTYYELKTATGNSIAMSIDSSTYVLTISLKNSAGTILNTQTVDLPLETMIVSGSYDSANKKIILTLQNGNTIEIPVGDLVSGLQSEITSDNKLSADLVDDTSSTNKFVSASDKTNWNSKQDIIQYSTMPTASSSTVGKIIQFTGTTTQDYTNGYFYIGTEDNGTYAWENINVQAGSSGEAIFVMSGSDYTTANAWLQASDISNRKFANIAFLVGSNSKLCYPIAIRVSDNYIYFAYWVLPNSFEVSYISDSNMYYCRFRIANNVVDDITSSMNNNFIPSIVTINAEQWVNAKKQFSVLPESSVVPTTDNQFTNKQYVDSVANPTVTTSSTSTYTIASLTGNQTYKLGEITSLTITATTTFDKESIIYFDSGSTATSISIPDSLINLGDVPTLTTASNVSTGTCEASKSYIIAVLNDIAVWKAY